MSNGFDRLPGRPRRVEPGSGVPDPQGKRALFSTEPAAPALGSVVVDCPACGQTTVLSPRQALRAALPSLHLPRAAARCRPRGCAARPAATVAGCTRPSSSEPGAGDRPVGAPLP